MAVSFSLKVICWERAGLLAILYVMFSCVFVTFPYDILGQVRYLIVSIPDPCFLSYFYRLLMNGRLTLNAPIPTKDVCFSRLLKCLRSFYGKQCGPRSDQTAQQSVLCPRCLLLYLIRQ